MRPRSVRLRARSGPETAISPTSRAFRPRITASMSSSTSVALGPTDFNERDTTHFGWRRRELVLLRTPLRTVFVPITHGLVHAATVHTAGQVAHVLYPVTEERGACPHFQVVDVAVQGLVHSKDELSHATKSPPQGSPDAASRLAFHREPSAGRPQHTARLCIDSATR